MCIDIDIIVITVLFHGSFFVVFLIVRTVLYVLTLNPLPSSRHHLSYDDCLEDKRIIRTVLCCVVYDSWAQWYAHTYKQSVKINVGLGLVFRVFVSVKHFVCFSSLGLDYFVLVLFAFVMLGLVSSVLCQEIGLGRTSPKWPILCRVGHKTLTWSLSDANERYIWWDISAAEPLLTSQLYTVGHKKEPIYFCL